MRPLTNVALEVHGVDELATLSGPVLLVANHSSELDAELVREAWPTSRSKLRVAESSKRAEADLRRGRTVLYFPEGAASTDGLIQDFDPVLGRIAASTGAPVVPIGIRGSYAARPPGQAWTAPGRPRVSVRFGRPVTWRAPKKSQDGDDVGHLAFTQAVSRSVEALIAEDTTSWWQVQRAASHDESSARPALWRRIWQQAEEPAPGGGSRRRGIWRR